MKFGKWLKRQIEQSLPEWRDQFVSYKELKRIVSSISGSPPSPADEALFVATLNADIDKIDSFFLEQEEEFVIRHRELQEAIKAAAEEKGMKSEDEIGVIRREVVDFHGEMVLLLNYSSINYIAVAKILKKYGKRTAGGGGGGAGVRLRPAVRRQRCFLETETVSRMVRECEAMAALLPSPSPATSSSSSPAAVTPASAAAAEQRIFRNTVAALVTMQDVRSGSSTHGRHSLPPLTLPDSDWLRSFHFQPPSPIPIQ